MKDYKQNLKSVLYFSLGFSSQKPQWNQTLNMFLQKVTSSTPVLQISQCARLVLIIIWAVCVNSEANICTWRKERNAENN